MSVMDRKDDVGSREEMVVGNMDKGRRRIGVTINRASLGPGYNGRQIVDFS